MLQVAVETEEAATAAVSCDRSRLYRAGRR